MSGGQRARDDARRKFETAAVVAYLASPEAAFVTGADIVADGGFSA